MKNKKKNMMVIALIIIALFMTGCRKEIEVKNGSKVAVSVKKEKFTATEYYSEIKEKNISTLIDMIDTSILEKKYKTDDEENTEVQKQIDQIKNIYGSEGNAFDSVLKSYFGVESEKELETRLRLEYKRKKAVEDYVKDHLEEKEIKDYYNDNIFGEVKASHILISINAKSSATEEEKSKAESEALEKANDLIKQLNDGKDFAKLAKKNSNDDATAINGGDLGYFDLDDMTETFREAVKKLKVDEYTKEPVKTEFGYHIILKTGEKEKPKLKEVKEEIKETLRDQKLENNNVLYYQTLMSVREDNKIKWNDTVLKKAYEDYMNETIEKASTNS